MNSRAPSWQRPLPDPCPTSVRQNASTIAYAAIVGLVAFSSSCGGDSVARRDVRIDSLPGGIRRVLSLSPIDSGRWHLTVSHDIQPRELEKSELLQPVDVAIADDGSVIIADSKPATVKVFAHDGSLLRTIGREGSGPGEFRATNLAVLGDTLVVQDASNSRATSFNWRTGAMLAERRTACCYYFPIGSDGDGRVAVRSMTPTPDSTLANPQAFVRFRPSATTAETLFVSAGAIGQASKPWLVREGNLVRMATAVPMQPRAYHVVDPAGAFMSAFSSEYLIRRTADGRDTVLLFGRAWQPAPISSSEKARLIDQRIAEMRAGSASDVAEATLRASFDPALIPDQRPAFEGVWADAAGRTWVRRVSDDTSRVQFDLFDSDGRWLDVVTVPGGSWPRSVWTSVALGRERAAVILEDEDGRPLIRVFRIERR